MYLYSQESLEAPLNGDTRCGAAQNRVHASSFVLPRGTLEIVEQQELHQLLTRSPWEQAPGPEARDCLLVLHVALQVGR